MKRHKRIRRLNHDPWYSDVPAPTQKLEGTATVEATPKKVLDLICRINQNHVDLARKKELLSKLPNNFGLLQEVKSLEKVISLDLIACHKLRQHPRFKTVSFITPKGGVE